MVFDGGISGVGSLIEQKYLSKNLIILNNFMLL